MLHVFECQLRVNRAQIAQSGVPVSWWLESWDKRLWAVLPGLRPQGSLLQRDRSRVLLQVSRWGIGLFQQDDIKRVEPLVTAGRVNLKEAAVWVGWVEVDAPKWSSKLGIKTPLSRDRASWAWCKRAIYPRVVLVASKRQGKNWVRKWNASKCPQER